MVTTYSYIGLIIYLRNILTSKIYNNFTYRDFFCTFKIRSKEVFKIASYRDLLISCDCSREFPLKLSTVTLRAETLEEMADYR